jgi:hydroxylamine reductase (hybrid-cluster protein)
MSTPTPRCSPPTIIRRLEYDHFVGNYGNAWWKQLTEFETFHGPILFTTNCIVPPRSPEVAGRIFTTNSAGYPGCPHIDADEKAIRTSPRSSRWRKPCPAPRRSSRRHRGRLCPQSGDALADKVVDAVKSGAIRRFFVMAGLRRGMKFGNTTPSSPRSCPPTRLSSPRAAPSTAIINCLWAISAASPVSWTRASATTPIPWPSSP